MVGLAFLVVMVLACVATLPYTLGGSGGDPAPRYKLDDPRAVRLPPLWVRPDGEEAQRLNRLVERPDPFHSSPPPAIRTTGR